MIPTSGHVGPIKISSAHDDGSPTSRGVSTPAGATREATTHSYAVPAREVGNPATMTKILLRGHGDAPEAHGQEGQPGANVEG